ncbi:MAG: phosphoenolpyruvate carboxykinase (ATP), partial [Gammaproteobacteria bacterium]|nr:phosphoenolpyruvate carboxykinase (ATP) [Gammaproteobacteria bacterium]
MVKGLDRFADFFAGDEAHYVLIGGVATYLALEDAGLQARATKDLDIVLCIEALDARFGEKLWAFIDQGGYNERQQGTDPRVFYRFAKPTAEDFPNMLEFFAREPGRLPMAEGAHLTPVPIGEAVQSLSAILLDDEYYHFLHQHTRNLGGVRVVTEQAWHCLFAQTLFIPQGSAAAAGSTDWSHDWTVINAGRRRLTPEEQAELGVSSPIMIAQSLEKKTVVILGTEYA